MRPCAHTLLSVSTTALQNTTIKNPKPVVMQGRACGSPICIEAVQESAMFATHADQKTQTGLWF